ncbi:MAG: FMN-binding negative transcriptional regulator [Neisseriaceae bacterium]|nr:FMN-binding negative transcriptional regulator [Neisseriaceae bacterium]
MTLPNPKSTDMTREECLFFLQKHAFGTLISSDLQISHVPFVLCSETHLDLHLAVNNPQLRALLNQPCVLSVLGPHAFISANYYVSKPAVPTWNYTAVQIKGVANVLSPDALEQSLNAMLAVFQPQLLNDPLTFPIEYKENLMRGIQGIRIDITEIKGKLKLGQHRSIDDQQQVFEHLSGGSETDALFSRFAQSWLQQFRPSVLQKD